MTPIPPTPEPFDPSDHDPNAVPVEQFVALFGGECFTVSDLQQLGMPLVHVSPEFYQLTGYAASEALGRDLGFLQHSDTEQRGNRELRDAVGKGRPCTVILRNYRKDGSLFWNEQRHYPVRNEDGDVTHLVTVQRDVTDRMNAAMSQDVGEAMARYLEEEGRFFGYSLLLREGREPSLAWLAEAARHLVGLSAVEIRQRGLLSIIHPEDRDLFERRLGRIQRSVDRHEGALPNRIFRDQYRMVTADGKVLWVEDAASVAWESGEAGVTAIHAVVRDITRLRKSQHAFWQLSHFDVLTGLPNRNILEDRLQQALARARRNGGHVGVVMMDLGPLRGPGDDAARARDRAVKRLAEELRRSVRRSDTLARFDGDRFALMLPDLTEPDGIVAVLDKLLAAVGGAGREDAGEAETGETVAIGVAMSPGSGTSPEDLLDAAHEAAERAKASGDSAYVVHDASVDDELRERIRLRADVHRALERREFVLHYQPRVRLSSGEITGVEALLRWVHPERGLLKPPAFLGSIRSVATARAISAWVLDEACRQARRWADERTPRRVSVNVPPIAVADAAFVATVVDALARHDLHPALLELELDGSSSAAELETWSVKLAELRAMGVRVSLDDFGESATPFSVLRALPLDTLKIAGSFQHHLTGSGGEAERGLLASIVSLAKSIDLHVVAEWVETPEQKRILQELGCDEGQGFLFSHAIPAEHVPLGALQPAGSRL